MGLLLLGAGPGSAPGLLLCLGVMGTAGSQCHGVMQPQAQLEDRAAQAAGPGATSLRAASASAP